MIVLILLVGSVLLLLKYRFKDRFIRGYGLFFLILLVYASNKGAYGIPDSMSEAAFSPLSLVRWAMLGLLFVLSVRMKRPEQFRMDVPLAAMSIMLVADMLFSSTYADNFNYSFFRALSFALLAIAMVTGATFYLHRAENCIHFFKFHYYIVWLAIVPMLLLHLTGLGSFGVTIIMGQYAGLFGNQNMYGTFSALVVPYVLFHWRSVAQSRRDRWLDVGLLSLIFVGLWVSRSRNGFTSCLIAIGVYFFVINLQSRLKVVAAAICVAVALLVVPTFQTDLREFLRKGSTQEATFGSQFIEEKRYEMWIGVLPLFWKEKLSGYGFASSHLLVFPFTKDEAAGRALHNSYLEIFGDLGLPGIILLLLILYRVGSKSVKLINQRGHPLERNINAVFISVFFAGLFNAFFESWMFSVGNLTSLLFWGPVAGVVARWAWKPVVAIEPEQRLP
ncbi:MAG: O-antigen ligase family protein, partial [Acidobacteriota bacterium]